MINRPEFGTLFFWFFFVVTVAWTVVAILFKAKELLKKRKG